MYYFDVENCVVLIDGVHAIPDSAIEITEETVQEILQWRQDGAAIGLGPDGCPVPVWPPKLTQEELAVAVRRERDTRLRACDPQALPDYPHESDVSRQAWLDYRQALRDVPLQLGFPWAGPQDPETPWPEEPA